MYTFSKLKSFARAAMLALLLVNVFQACDRDESAPFEPVEYEKFSGLLFSKTLNLEELSTEVLRQFGMQSIEEVLRLQGIPESEIKSLASKIRLYIKLSGEYDVHGITYHTVSSTGEAVVASGVLFYPKSRNPKGVIEIVPWIKSKSECGTVNYHMPEALPGINGYVCIVPDQIGYGSTAERPIDYLNYENAAVVCADMRQAAGEFVYNYYRRKLDTGSFLFGYSLGGGGALSLAKYYHRHPERGVKVKELFIGGGAYDPLSIMESQFASCYSEQAVLPNVICSWNHYEDLQLDFSKIFKGKLHSNYAEWCYGQYSLDELTERLGTNLRDYFTDAFLKKEDSPEFQLLLEVCRKRKISGDWNPGCKVHIFHGEDDGLVPIVCSDRMYDELRGMGVDVIYKKYDADHMESAKLMIVDFWRYLNNF